jgi:hypothetical protein
MWGDARQAKPHFEYHPLSLLGTCHATPMRKLNGPGWQQSRWTNCWTFIMRCTTLGRSRRDAKTGVRKRAPGGAPNSVAACCKARWTRSLRPCKRSVEAVTARRSAHSARTLSRTGGLFVAQSAARALRADPLLHGLLGCIHPASGPRRA